jgi:hypothetical protein
MAHYGEDGTLTQSEFQAVVRTATKVVAASDASDDCKGLADYVCLGSADDVQIQDAIDDLTSGRTWIETVKCVGGFSLSDTVKLPSYTRLDLTETILTQTASTEMIQNANPGGSDSNIEVIGGILDGDSIGSGEIGVDFYTVTDGLVMGVYVHHTTGAGIRFYDSIRCKAINNRIYYPSVGGGASSPGLSCGGSTGNGSHDIVLLNNHVTNSPGEGIDVNAPCSRVFVLFNNLSNNAEEDIDAGSTYDVHIIGNIIRSEKYGIRPPFSGEVSNNIIIGGVTGIYASGARGISLIDNIIWGQSNYCIYIKNSDDFYISGGRLSRASFNGIRLENADYCTVNNVHIVDNSQGNLGNRCGIVLAGSSNHNLIQGNHVTDTQTGITSSLASNAASGQKDVVVDDAELFFDEQYLTISDDTPQSENIQIDSIALSTKTLTLKANLTNSYTTAQNALVTGRATQGTPISEEDTADYNVIINNKIQGNVSDTIATVGSNTTIRDNIGYVTENWGTDSIASGTTSKVVAHGLSATPTKINIAFREQGTNDYGRWWVDNIGSSTFQVNVSADPGASNLDFDWEAKVR